LRPVGASSGAGRCLPDDRTALVGATSGTAWRRTILDGIGRPSYCHIFLSKTAGRKVRYGHGPAGPFRRLCAARGSAGHEEGRPVRAAASRRPFWSAARNQCGGGDTGTKNPPARARQGRPFKRALGRRHRGTKVMSRDEERYSSYCGRQRRPPCWKVERHHVMSFGRTEGPGGIDCASGMCSKRRWSRGRTKGRLDQAPKAFVVAKNKNGIQTDGPNYSHGAHSNVTPGDHQLGWAPSKWPALDPLSSTSWPEPLPTGQDPSASNWRGREASVLAAS